MARDRSFTNSGSSSGSTIVIQVSTSGGKRGLEKVVSKTQHSKTTTGGKRAIEVNVVKKL